MTTSPAIRIKLLLVSMMALGGLMLALSASNAHAQGNSAIDQYLEQNPDGGAYHGPKKGGSKGGSGGSGGSSSSSGSGGSGGNSSSDGDAATKDYNGDGTIDDKDDKIAAEKKKQKKDKKDDDKSDAIAGAGDDGGSGGSSSSPQLAGQTVPAEDDGGSSSALWIVLALLVLGPVAVFAFLRFGRRGRGGTSEPQGT